MGVVVKQSFWSTFISYAGVIVGYVNTLYFRAEYFTLDQIGLFILITANAMIVSPLSSFGMSSSFMKFFPAFEEKDRNRFLSLLFLITLLGNVLILSVGFLMKDIIAIRYIDSAPTYIDYLFVTAIVIFANSLFELFFSYSRSILKVIFPSFLRDIYLRLGSMCLVLGYAFELWNFDSAIIGLGIVYFSAFLLLFFQLVLLHRFRFEFSFHFPGWGPKLLQFGIYSMLLAASFALVNNLSYDQITAAIGAEATGIFTTCFFIATIVEMPRRNMAKVITPFISLEMENKNLAEVKSLYQRSSITMSIIGILIFIGICTNLDNLFDFIPKGDQFISGYWVVLIVCLTKLLMMIFSFSGEIINFSHLYRYNLIFQVLAALLLGILNYFLIPVWGINGAAMSYFIAITVQIILKTAFVKFHFGMLPIVRSHLWLLLISVLVIVLAYWFDASLHPVVTIGIRAFLTTLIFVPLVYHFKISTDFNRLIDSTFERFQKIKLKK